MALRWATEKNKSLFSKLQSLAFYSPQPQPIEMKIHLDIETQEIVSKIKSNIQKLNETNQKMGFMLEEIQYVLKKKF